MRLLLDTSTFLWTLYSPEKISARALAALRQDNAECQVSSLSLTEIAIKNSTGKLRIGSE